MVKNSPQPALKPVGDSMFYMWRCIIVMAHADGVIHKSEREFFEKVFANMARAYTLTKDQADTFARDLESPQDIDQLLPNVADTEFRSLLLYFSQIVAWIDGDLSPHEANLLKKLHSSRGDGSEQIMADIRQQMASQVVRRREDGEKQILRHPLYYALDALLDRLGIPPID